MPTLEQTTQFLRTRKFTALFAAAVGAALIVLPYPVKYYGLQGALGVAAGAVGLAAITFHPLVPFGLYFGSLFLPETTLPGFPVSANQAFGVLFLASVVAFLARGKALKLQSRFVPLLIVAAVYFSISAITGESAVRGPVHMRYVATYFALAIGLAWSLKTERSILALAWIITTVTFLAAVYTLVEALERNLFAGFAGKITNQLRLRGTAKNSISFGWNMVFAFPFAFFLFSEIRSLRMRWFALGMGLFILLDAVLTFNRQTFVAIAAVVGVGALLHTYANRKLLMTALVVVGTAVTVAFFPMLMARLLTVTDLSKDISYLDRRDNIYIGSEMIRQHPITGIGLGSYPAVWKKYIPRDIPTYYMQYTHATHLRFPDFGYMQLLAETGIIGLLLYVSMLVFWAARAWKLRALAVARGDAFAVNFASMMVVLVMFLAMTSFIQDTFLYVRVWFGFGLLLLLDERVLLPREVESAELAKA